VSTLYAFDGASPDIDSTAFLAPGVIAVGNVKIGPRASIWFQAVVRGDINSVTIGAETNIQDGCLLHVTHRHALRVDERVTVGHGAILHGCHIEADCLIAMGAIVLDGAIVGKGSLVGAGSLVPPGMTVPPGSLVMGVPAKVIRQLTDDDRNRVMRGWQNYVGYAESYRTQLAAKFPSDSK
jgi:carbonic anhydrase/acetyltransferase-like protein (isoleucine patch superfamily)